MTTTIAPTKPTDSASSLPGRCKLTKTLYMKIPAGVFLISNCCTHDGQPVFAEPVAAPDERSRQWRRIVESGASSRLCLITDRKTDFHTMRGAFPRDTDSRNRLLKRRAAVVSRADR